MNAAELAERFGLGRARALSEGPVARGRMGEVWRLETSDGSWAVKVPFHDAPDEVGTALQEAAGAAGVPAPSVCRASDGRVSAAIGGRRVRLYEWVDLLPPTTRLDPEVVGATVAAIHRVRLPAAGPVEAWHTAPLGAEVWDPLIARLRAAGAPFAARLAGLRDEFVALESWLAPPGPVQLCHRDLWCNNILPTARGGVCVIDWDNSGPADPAQELALVLFEFARRDAGRARALMAAYTAGGGPARLTGPGDFSMLIAQMGHCVELAAGDWLTPTVRNPDRSGAEAWIGEIIGDPHTRAVLTGLLTSVAEPGSRGAAR